MEPGNRTSSSNSDKKSGDKKRPKSSDSEVKKSKDGSSKDGVIGRRKNTKISMIPRLKLDRTETKGNYQKQKPQYVPSRTSSTSSKTNIPYDDYDQKLKLLEVKEKSIAEYNMKIEKLIQTMLAQKEKANEIENESEVMPTSVEVTAKKMTSDPLVFTKKTKNQVLSDFEKDVKQISEIWLRTSTDLSNTLKNLKNNPTLDPIEFEVESVRIQLAIKQAKSLTLVKTRNVIAEAKKLMLSKGAIRTELENLLSYEKLKLAKHEAKKCNCVKEKHKHGSKPKNGGEKKKEKELGGTGDTRKEEGGLSLMEKELEENNVKEIKEPSSEDSSGSNDDRERSLDTKPETSLTIYQPPLKTNTLAKSEAEEITKKNEIITQLSNKIFDLQKACDDHSEKYNKLQLKIIEFQAKIQWDQILWKQIGKLKERIRGLQESNRQLETQKVDLESKISKMNLELERLIKLNQVLNKKNFLLNQQDKFMELGSSESGSGEEVNKKSSKEDQEINIGCKPDGVDRVLVEKQNVIDHLKKILDMMKDQENVAQQQIAVFESKIQELQRKNT